MKELIDYLKKKWWVLLLLVIMLVFLPKFYDWLFSIYISDFFVMKNIKASDMLSYTASMLTFLATFTIGQLTYQLNKKIKEDKDKRYNAGIKPYLMLNRISIFKTKAEIRDSQLCYKNVSSPFFGTPRKDNLQCVSIEIINTSNNICRAEMKNFILKKQSEENIFNGSTTDIKSSPLFLDKLSTGTFSFVTDAIDTFKGVEGTLEIIMRNNFGKAYLQTIEFYIICAVGGDVKYEIKNMGDPEIIERANQKI